MKLTRRTTIVIMVSGLALGAAAWLATGQDHESAHVRRAMPASTTTVVTAPRPDPEAVLYVLAAGVPATNSAVTQATISSTICVPGWTRAIRPPSSTTSRIKTRLEAALGYHGPAELDHAIPLELGGAPGLDGRNLWIEPQPHARAVDVIENRLHRDVCDGRKTLAAAQAEIIHLKETGG